MEGLLERVGDWLAALGPAELLAAAGIPVVLVLLAALRGLRRSRKAAEERARSERALERRLAAVETAADGIGVLGPSGRFAYANEALAGLLGRGSARSLYGKGWRACVGEDAAARLEREAIPAASRGGGWVGEVTARRPDGSAVDLDLSVTGLDEGGMTWIARDAGWRTGDGARRERAYRAVFQSAGSVIALLSAGGLIEEWNREAERLFEIPRRKAVGRPFLEMVSPSRRDEAAAELERVTAGAEAAAFEAPADTRGAERVLLWTVRRLEEDGGEAGRLIAVGQDITERRRTERALARQEGLYRLLAHNSSDLVALHRPDGRFEYVSPSSEVLLGYSRQELEGRDLYEITHSDDWQRIQAALVSVATGRVSRFACRLRNSAGEYVWYETLLRPIHDDEGTLVQLQSSSRDISERKAFEERLQHQALHEPLTGLPNRTLFLDRVNQALARARREEASVAVLFMDLDRFKIVNDSLGHAAGDRLLAAVAQRMRTCVREGDTVARLGGDEFGVLLEFDVDREAASIVAERFLRQLQPPFHLSGREVFVTGSIGIAFGSSATEKAEDLLRFADVAMYRAKEQGTASYRVFDPEVDTRATRRLELETSLRRALERGELVVFYQPIVSLETGRIVGHEALVRWRHPELGMVSPGEFIPVAEESGLIVPIGAWVLREACARAREWSGLRKGEPVSISVNLSARQFEQPDLEDTVRDVLEETGLAPELLHLEITESELLQRPGRLETFEALGVRVAIDDFGTGFSSLSYLKDLRVHELKIDRSFVQGLGERPRDAAIVHTVVTLADSLELAVVAEGIETESQLARLREMGCKKGQGYFFARPAPAEEAAELLRSDPEW